MSNHDQPKPRPDRTPLVDRVSALNRMGGDHELFADVIGMFLEDCPMRVAAIKSAVDNGQTDRIRAEAHALKGAAANVSALVLVEAARTLERIGSDASTTAAADAWQDLFEAAGAVMEELKEIRRELTQR